MAGQMVHVEIPAGDTAKAREFWGSLFGWQFQAFEGSPSEYLMTRLSETSGGAILEAEGVGRGPPRLLRRRRHQRRRCPREGARRRVRRSRCPFPGMGWFATCKDNEGNNFGLWQNDPVGPSARLVAALTVAGQRGARAPRCPASLTDVAVT